jgi:hypothetical protein
VALIYSMLMSLDGYVEDERGGCARGSGRFEVPGSLLYQPTDRRSCPASARGSAAARAPAIIS